jgi:hypothetical protein
MGLISTDLSKSIIEYLELGAMGKHEVNAKDVVSDIRSGMSLVGLSEKYRLSRKGLESLFTKLVTAKLLEQRELDNLFPKKKVDLKEVAEDVRAGLTDRQLIEKHNISNKSLQEVFNKLLDGGFLTGEEFYNRMTVDVEEISTTLQGEDSVELGDLYKESPVAPTKAKKPQVDPRKQGKQLIRAAQDGNVERAGAMIKLGADINFQDEFGDSALTVAADNGRLEVIKLLADHGADLLITDEDGNTAFQIATNRNFQDIRDFLREKDAAQ